MLLVQVRAAYRCRLLRCAVAYMLKVPVGLNKPLLLNERFAEVVTVSQITSSETSSETSREVAKRPGIETSV